MNHPFIKPAVPRPVRPTVARPKSIVMRAAEPVPLPIPFIGLFRFVRRRPGKVAMFALLGLLLVGYFLGQYNLAQGSALMAEMRPAMMEYAEGRAIVASVIRGMESAAWFSHVCLSLFALIGGGWVLKTWAEKHFTRK